MIDIWSIKGVREYFPLESDDFHGEMSHLETLENKKIFLYNLSRFPVAHLFPFSGFLPILNLEGCKFFRDEAHVLCLIFLPLGHSTVPGP